MSESFRTNRSDTSGLTRLFVKSVVSLVARSVGQILVLFSVIASAHAHAAIAPGFDCAKSRKAVELVICSDDELSAMDAALNRMVKEALEHKVRVALDRHQYDEHYLQRSRDIAQRTLRHQMREWLPIRDRSCDVGAFAKPKFEASACLREVYDARIKALMQDALFRTIWAGQYPLDKAELLTPLMLYPETSFGQAPTFILGRFVANRIGDFGTYDIEHFDPPSTTMSERKLADLPSPFDYGSHPAFVDATSLLLFNAGAPNEALLAGYGAAPPIPIYTAEHPLMGTIALGRIAFLEGTASSPDRIESYDNATHKLLFSRRVAVANWPWLFWEDHLVAFSDETITVYGSTAEEDWSAFVPRSPTTLGGASPQAPFIQADRLFMIGPTGRLIVFNLRTRQTEATLELGEHTPFVIGTSGDFVWTMPKWVPNGPDWPQPRAISVYSIASKRLLATVHIFANDFQVDDDALEVFQTGVRTATVYRIDSAEVQALDGVPQ